MNEQQIKVGNLIPSVTKPTSGTYEEEQPHKKVKSETKIDYPIMFKVIQRSGLARAAQMILPHGVVNTPVYMPVGTKGAMKALIPEDMTRLGCQILLSNTYHLNLKPGPEKLIEFGGLHQFMNWKGNILTDSGGFQMVSLNELCEIKEEGVVFKSHIDGTPISLPPQQSMSIQNAIGADIMMALDDVVKTTTTGPRVEEACNRSIRWLDRCIESHGRKSEQCLFAIIQGGVDQKLRRHCLTEMIKRKDKVAGYAIGGLAGGEDKEDFWQTVALCSQILPADKPRYVMGIGYPQDLVICVALGCDMFDCVFPTRTARFGTAFTREGPIKIRNQEYSTDFKKIDQGCDCQTCRDFTRSYLNRMFSKDKSALQLLSLHNIHFLFKVMRQMRDAIQKDELEDYVRMFFILYYKHSKQPEWIEHALNKAFAPK